MKKLIEIDIPEGFEIDEGKLNNPYIPCDGSSFKVIPLKRKETPREASERISNEAKKIYEQAKNERILREYRKIYDRYFKIPFIPISDKEKKIKDKLADMVLEYQKKYLGANNIYQKMALEDINICINSLNALLGIQYIKDEKTIMAQPEKDFNWNVSE